MTRSKSEVAPDGSTQTPEGLPRRKVLMMTGLGVFSALLPSGDTPQPSAEQCQDHEKDSFQPVVVRLGVVALNAADPMLFKYRLKTQVREVGARLRAVWDVLSGKEARHYGDPIPFPPES